MMTSKTTAKQNERQNTRNRDGRYSKVKACEVCRVSTGTGNNYYTDERCNGVFKGRGLVLCEKCADKLVEMSDADALALLKK